MNPIVELCAKEVPTNWLDPLLTGKNAVIKEPPYTGTDIERLLRAIKERIESLPAPTLDEPTRQLCIQACREVAKRIPHSARDCIAAIEAIPGGEIDRAAGGSERIARLESLLNHAVTELSRAALSEDFESQDCLDCIKMIEDEFSAVGKTTDWQTLSNLYDRLCAACGVSNEDEIDIMPIVEERLRAAPAALPDEYVKVPKMVIDWLMGSGPNPSDGTWFERPIGAPAFWWRSELRKLLAAAQGALK